MMKKSTLESLPNELLLKIFSYLSSFDLCQAFFDLKNVRIQHLLTCISHSFDVSLMHYNQLRRFLLSNNNDFMHYFTALIDTIVLRNSCACRMLFSHWDETFHDTQQINMFLPSIKRLFILNTENYQYGLVQGALLPFVFAHNTLQYVHLVFKQPTNSYSSILSELVHHRISVNTMILEVEKGTLFNIFSNRRT
jgi:hypothetical protein